MVGENHALCAESVTVEILFQIATLRRKSDRFPQYNKAHSARDTNTMGEVEKMVAVGLVWGATNGLMRKGALIWDEKIKSTAQTHPPHHPVLRTVKNWLGLLLTWQYSVPFMVNLSASATFFAILSDTPISLAVPVTNATTFAATAVFGMLLGEETHVGLALFGTFLIILGVYFCIM